MANKQKLKPPVCGSGDSGSLRLPMKASVPGAAKPARRLCRPSHPLVGSLGATIFTKPAWREISRSLGLSVLQLQIVQAMFDDHTEASIAGRLKISPHTVHTHFERLYRKLGVTGRVRLALRVMDEYIALTLAPETVLPPLCANFAIGRCPLRSK